MDKLDEQPKNITPRELYRGLGFMTLAKIQDQFNPDAIKIVTGGLGLTDMDEQICPYDFTASPKEPENIHQVVTAEPYVQTVWWRMINDARDKGVAPVCDLISSNTSGFVIISCSKIFLRYISDDILSTPFEYRSRIRILLAASSQGSVPAQLRPMMIPFDRQFVGDIPGNRNDNNHRAAFRFLELLEENPEFAASDIAKQRQFFMNIQGSPQHNVNYGSQKIDLEAFLKERPHYLTMDPDMAYKMSRRELGTIGGKMHFRGIFRKLTLGSSLSIAAGDYDIDRATSAMSGMSFLSNNGNSNNNPTHLNEEDAVLEKLQVFVHALKQVAPKAVFSSADVCKWAQTYQGAEVLDAFKSPNKLAYIIKANIAILGLQDAGSSGYTIAAGDAGAL